MNGVLGGWQLSTKVFWHTGLPFSVTDANAALGNGGGDIFAQPLIAGPLQTSCGESSNYISGTSCLNANGFINSGDSSFTGYSQWSGLGRNSFRGPGYFDMDMALFKNFKLTERLNFGIGAQAFNVLNHPNFANPDSGYGDATFGQITGMLGTPTSPYGNFLGFDSSPRVLQVSGKITFKKARTKKRGAFGFPFFLSGHPFSGPSIASSSGMPKRAPVNTDSVLLTCLFLLFLSAIAALASYATAVVQHPGKIA